MDVSTRHIPVLLQETLSLLSPRPGGRYLDGTLGLGGHAAALLEAAGEGARLLGLDRDEQALALAGERLAPFGEAARWRHLPFSRFEEALDEAGWDTVDGALVDLGVSSLQLDSAERGFSFIQDGPLDMRMDQAEDESALDLVNGGRFEDLKRIIKDLGEEPLGGKIARAIVNRREKKPFETTLDLAQAVSLAYPPQRRHAARNHPATRTFQALRMAVNRELEELAAFLRAIPSRLASGGRVAVISFHSLEDRLVKQTFRDLAQGCTCQAPPRFCVCNRVAVLRLLTKKPVVPGEAECQANSRARSAKLRAAERLPVAATPHKDASHA